jgi:hypothetical protein
MKRRTIAGSFGLALIFLLHVASAHAEYRGTDLWSNLAINQHGGSAFDRYPLSYFQLDYHVDVGITNTDGVPPMIAQFTSSMLFMASTWLMRTTISIFDWAFNLDVVNGTNGALKPVTVATQDLYAHVIFPLLGTVIIAFGIWLAYKALSKRHAEAGGGLIRVIVLTVVALVLVYKPDQTIGRAFQYSKALSSEIVSGHQGSQDVSDRLFETFIYRPWAVLQFGGLKVCTGATTDDDGFPLAATKRNPAKVCHPVLHKGADGHGDYAHRFLAYAYASKERDNEYKALKDGEAPDTPQFKDAKIDRTDAPAVDAMQAGGAVQRLMLSAILLIGTLGAVLFLGFLSCASVFAQLALLVLYALTPAMVLVAALPSLHKIFWGWARLIGMMLIASVVYSLMLGAALGVSQALMEAAGDALFFFAFMLQSLLFIGLFIARKQLAGIFMSHRSYHRGEQTAKSFITTAAATSAGTVATPFAAAGRAANSNSNRGWQQAANRPSDSKKPSDGQSSPDSVSPPASAGREYSSSGSDMAEQDKTPFDFRAAGQRARDRDPGPPPPYWHGPPDDQSSSSSTTVANMPEQGRSGEEASMGTFKQDLERERARRANLDVRTAERQIVPASKYQPKTGVARPDNLVTDLELARERRAQEQAKAPGK